MRAATPSSPSAAGRRGLATDRQVMSLSDFESEIRELDGDAESANILLYGDSGCGKTVLAGSAPNSLILACGPGYISAARVSLGVPVGKRKVRPVPDSATALAGIEWLESGGYKEYEWVVVEDATILETKVRLGYAAEAFDANPEKRQHRNLPDKPDYFNTQNFLRSWIARLVDLPVNLLITAHAMRFDDDSGDRLVVPSFQQRDGALSNYVSGLMHCVGFMRPRWVDSSGRPVSVDKRPPGSKQVRRILWQQTTDPNTGTIYFAKDQFDVLGRTMDDTNMQEIMKKIEPEMQEQKVTPRARRR